jgi:hypothetical protein
MSRRTIQIDNCNICGAEKQTDLIPKLPPPGDWLILKVKSGTDAREKVEAVICASCLLAIADRVSHKPDEPVTQPTVEPAEQEYNKKPDSAKSRA